MPHKDEKPESFSRGIVNGDVNVPGYTPQKPTEPREERAFPEEHANPKPKRPSANELLIDDHFNF